jgi:hypothetical protein
MVMTLEQWGKKISRMRLKTLLNPETPWVFPTETNNVIEMMTKTKGWNDLTPKVKRKCLSFVIGVSEHVTSLGEIPVLEDFRTND